MDIVVSHLWKSYGEKTVFAGFSCQIPRGSRCAVLAPSGSGKTTLLLVTPHPEDIALLDITHKISLPR